MQLPKVYKRFKHKVNKMKNIVVDFLSIELCEKNPTTIFVYGDNLIDKGEAGQAIIRNCENAFGIPTKRLPCMYEKCFFSDKEDELFAVQQALMFLYGANQARNLAWPKDGIGTGLAQLKAHSPMINEILNLSIAALFGDPYNTIKQKTPPERG